MRTQALEEEHASRAFFIAQVKIQDIPMFKVVFPMEIKPSKTVNAQNEVMLGISSEVPAVRFVWCKWKSSSLSSLFKEGVEVAWGFLFKE